MIGERRDRFYVFILLTILGGVALIQYGVRILRKGTDRLCGSQVGPLLQNIAKNPGRALFSGLGISFLVPSSTGLSSLAVQTVQSGYVSISQMLGVLLGADLGLTLISQLLALRVDSAAPILLLVGFALFQYTSASKLRGAGQVLLSFGLLFLGIGIIQSAAAGVDPHGDLVQLLEIAGHNPVRMAVVAAILSLAFQSSTAVIGLFIGLATSNTVSLTMPILIAGVVGANVGVALTTLFIGWTQISSRRLGVANLVAKSIVAVLVLATLPWVVRLIDQTPGNVGRHVANAHTGFNLLKAIVIFPLVNVLTRLVPNPPAGAKQTFGPRYIGDGPIEGASLALGQSLREVLRVSELVRAMFDDWWRAFANNLEPLARQVSDRDDEIDLLDREIQKFLSRVGAENLEADQAAEQMRQLRFLSELETVGDVVERNLSELVYKKVKHAPVFSKDSWRALEVFGRLVKENMLIAETVFHTRDRLLAQKLLRHKEAVNRCAGELRDQHFGRLNRGLVESHETTAIYLDAISNLRRINSHFSHVAHAVLQSAEPPSPIQQLLVEDS